MGLLFKPFTSKQKSTRNLISQYFNAFILEPSIRVNYDLILTMNALRTAKLRAAVSAIASAVLTYHHMLRSLLLSFLASLAYRSSARVQSASMGGQALLMDLGEGEEHTEKETASYLMLFLFLWSPQSESN